MAKKESIDLTHVMEVMRECLGIAEGIARGYMTGPIVVPDAELYHFNFGLGPKCAWMIDGKECVYQTGAKNVKLESNEDAQVKVVARFLQILREALPEGGSLWPPNASFYGASIRMSPKMLATRIAYEMRSDRIGKVIDNVFRWGSVSEDEKLLLVESLVNMGEAANDAISGGGQISDEYETVLKEWKRLGEHATLSHKEVGDIFCKLRKVDRLPSQCNQPSAFLYRFAKKLGKAGTRANWILRDSARERIG